MKTNIGDKLANMPGLRLLQRIDPQYRVALQGIAIGAATSLAGAAISRGHWTGALLEAGVISLGGMAATVLHVARGSDKVALNVSRQGEAYRHDRGFQLLKAMRPRIPVMAPLGAWWIGGHAAPLINAVNRKEPLEIAGDTAFILVGALLVHRGLRPMIHHDAALRDYVSRAKEDDRIAEAKSGKIIDLTLPPRETRKDRMLQ